MVSGQGSVQGSDQEIRVRRRWLARLRSGFGVPRYELTEVEKLGNHIWERLSLDQGGQAKETARLKDWVTSRFTEPLRALLVQSSSNMRGHVLLSLIVIGGGFATSGIAVAAGTGHKSSATSWIVFSVGLVVALAGGISQIFRPGYRATQRDTLTRQLREEGWAFAMGTKDYALNDPQAFERFDERVSAIHRRAAEIIGLEPESGTRQTATAKPAKKQQTKKQQAAAAAAAPAAAAPAAAAASGSGTSGSGTSGSGTSGSEPGPQPGRCWKVDIYQAQASLLARQDEDPLSCGGSGWGAWLAGKFRLSTGPMRVEAWCPPRNSLKRYSRKPEPVQAPPASLRDPMRVVKAFGTLPCQGSLAHVASPRVPTCLVPPDANSSTSCRQARFAYVDKRVGAWTPVPPETSHAC